MAVKENDEFIVTNNSDYILKNINTVDNLEYAPSLSVDLLELYFTRLNLNLSTPNAI